MSRTIGEVNGIGKQAYSITARDVARHGAGHDTFSISIQRSAGSYQNSGVLTAGNLHLHPGK